ncbi:ABC transporter ATP-binding protein [Shumkonia mesophila]|uniref:ABC transporter ATP-binding protein n=1 Tax=Shumkonia mesophila TaxID=2838854 RepID=UPI002934B7DF|nr:ABC transporter ATP-binding protein [Shumkonia mesophila]
MSPLLSIRNLSKAFGGVEAVRGVSFAVHPGEAVALIGPNGAGKTTCFNLIGGQLRPDAGGVEFRGRDIAGWPPHRVWRLGIGRTFQVAAIFPSMTVAENVQMALASHAGKGLALLAPLARLGARQADALLARVGLAAQAGRACGLLAYGDLKRLELALALANDPALLLMDEPMAGVARGERAELMALIGRVVAEEGVSVLFTEHDMEVVFGHASRIVVLHRGEVVADGVPEAVRADARVREVYLGTEAGQGAAPC